MLILSPDTLTILILVSFSLSSVTFFIVIIYSIIFLCKCYAKRRHRLDAVEPLTSPSVLSIDPRISYSNNQNYHLNERSSIKQKHSFEYLHNDNDETTRIQNINQSLHYPIEPMINIRNFDRQTPYPADVLARERYIYNNRL